MKDIGNELITGAAPVTLLNAVLRTNLPAFVRKAFGTVSAGDRYALNWHIKAICYHLEKVMRGEIKRLIITVPPRHLKSICASVAFPAWVLGHDPTRKIICVSYAHDLAAKHGNDCRAVMGTEWYRRVFPATKIDPDKNSEIEFMTTERGYRLSTSVGGVLTGRGGDLIIVDDPMKPADANSEIARAHVIDWHGGTLISRLNDKEHDAIVVVMQRLHEGDLIGHLLQQQGWTHLNLPAIAELEDHIEIGPAQFHIRHVGELLHPERESKAALDDLKRTMGSATFAAQYQQAPVPPGGNMIDWAWFQWFNPDKPPKFEKIHISWDTAMKATERSDYSVATVWGECFGFYYLLDVIRERLEFPALLRKVTQVYHHWHLRTGLLPRLLIEDAGFGTALIQALRHQQIYVHGVRPVGEKIVRMGAQSPKIEAGEVYLPLQAPWLKDFRTEVLAFPHSVHDDQVDSMSQALGYMSNQPAFGAIGVGPVRRAAAGWHLY